MPLFSKNYFLRFFNGEIINFMAIFNLIQTTFRLKKRENEQKRFIFAFLIIQLNTLSNLSFYFSILGVFRVDIFHLFLTNHENKSFPQCRFYIFKMKCRK